MTKFDDEMYDGFQQAMESERVAKLKKGFADEIWNVIRDSTIDNMASAITDEITIRTSKAIEAIVKGDERELERALGVAAYTGREREHPVIHGEFHENFLMEKRRKIVDAFPERLKNERIKDLEAIQESLIKQVNDRENTIKRLSDNLAYYQLTR